MGFQQEQRGGLVLAVIVFTALACAGGCSIEDFGIPVFEDPAADGPKGNVRAPTSTGPTYTAGVLPLAIVGRTDLGTELELRNAVGVEAGYLDVDTGAWLFPAAHIGVAWVPLREKKTEDRADLIYVDLGIGDAFEKGRWLAFVTVGYSIMFMDFEGGDRETLGAGLFLRGGVSPVARGRWKLELHGELHGWAGGDSDGFRTAGAVTAGVNIGCSF